MPKPASSGPRVAFWDIETAPKQGFYFDAKREYAIIECIRESYIYGFCYQWQGETKVHHHFLPDYPLFDKDHHDDKSLCNDLWKLMDEADVLIAQNGDRFDVKQVNTRLLVNKFRPPSPFKTIDTLKIARKNFAFDSNRLDAIGKALTVGRKMATMGKKLWLDCYNGDRDAFQKMDRYCRQDVRLLADVYNEMAPFHRPHPNLTGFNGNCPVCKSPRVIKRGTETRGTGVWQRLTCSDCGHYPPERKIMKVAA
jgi:uncharacterized protein YprB with RNaseH-like and TPR domain